MFQISIFLYSYSELNDEGSLKKKKGKGEKNGVGWRKTWVGATRKQRCGNKNTVQIFSLPSPPHHNRITPSHKLSAKYRFFIGENKTVVWEAK